MARSHTRERGVVASLDEFLASASESERREAKRLAKEDCWRTGRLRYKCDSNQRGLYDAIYSCRRRRFVLECARRLGKSYLLCVLAVEACLRKRNSRVVYAAQTQREVGQIVVPNIESIIEDAPDECRPEWKALQGHYEFPNGSILVVFGAEDKRKANRGRGPGADLVVVDEAGFIPILSYVLTSVLNPQTMTTGGRTIIASTPSDEPDHDFTKIAEAAEAEGAYETRTVYDNPRLTRQQIDEYMADDAALLGMTVQEFMESDAFRREYLAERVVDRTLVVMGEDWASVRESSLVEVERPKLFDAYVALDMGGVDPHAVLFGYWHFPLSSLVIEDELLFRDGCNTAELAEAIRAKEAELYGTSRWDGSLRLYQEPTSENLLAQLPEWLMAQVRKEEAAPRQPLLRVCDNDIQIAKDLSTLHGISFVPTQKTDKRWYVNEFRILCRQGRVKVHPRCRNLDRHLRSTVWSNHRMADYKRNQAGEHGDLLDCAVYMSRNVNKNRNPEPAGTLTQDTLLIGRRKPDAWRQALGLTKLRRPV